MSWIKKLFKKVKPTDILIPGSGAIRRGVKDRKKIAKEIKKNVKATDILIPGSGMLRRVKKIKNKGVRNIYGISGDLIS